MDCNECKREMVSLFDSDVDQTLKTWLEEHLLQCSKCAAEFQKAEEALSMLKPQTLLEAPFLLKQNIINQ